MFIVRQSCGTTYIFGLLLICKSVKKHVVMQAHRSAVGRPDYLLVSLTLLIKWFPVCGHSCRNVSHSPDIFSGEKVSLGVSSPEYLFLFLFLLTYMCMQYNKRKRFGNCFAFVFVFPFVLFSLCSLVFVSFTYILTPL